MEPWPRVPFSPELRYTVLRPAKNWPDKLIAGETVRYLRAEWSRYHGFTVYHFAAPDGMERSWALMDDEPVERWTQFFTPAGP